MKKSTTFKLLLIGLACACGAKVASGGPAEERRFRELIDGPILLTSDARSASDLFQFEIQCRIVNADGTRTNVRALAQRRKDKLAVLLLSDDGVPSAFLVGTTFLVIDEHVVRIVRDACFDCQAGATSEGPVGLDITYSGTFLKSSQITLDLRSLAQLFMVDDAEYGWDSRSGRCWTATPRGAYLCYHLDRRAGPKEFPIRAVVVKACGVEDGSRLEISLSNFSIASPLARDLFQMARPENGIEDIPVALGEFAQLTRTPPLSDLGASFDDRDENARRLGLKLLRRLRTLDDLAVSDERLNGVQALLTSLRDAAEPQVMDALRELRQLGARHVWGGLEERPGHGRSRDVAYDRFQAAGRTEVAFGPEMTPLLRQRLADVAANRDLSVETRGEALDLLGQFGLPVLSPRLDDLEQSLAAESSEELRVVLSSVRVRQTTASDNDFRRLHRALADRRLSPSTLTLALEALAIAHDLAPHADKLPNLVSESAAPPSETLRRLRALASAPVGRSALLELLEQGSAREPRVAALSALNAALAPSDEEWPRFQRLARSMALAADRSPTERVAANGIVRRDPHALASSYTEEFYRSALADDDADLVLTAMWNMVDVGKGPACFEAIKGKLAHHDAAKRVEGAILCSAVATREWKSRQRLSPGFWPNLDTIFRDSDPEVRRFGPIHVLLLTERGAPMPASYVAPLVETALAAEDSTHLGLACRALERVTNSDYKFPCPPGLGKGETLPWISNNAAAVREHLQTWHSAWRRNASERESATAGSNDVETQRR